jgi:hypothetical protein
MWLLASMLLIYIYIYMHVSHCVISFIRMFWKPHRAREVLLKFCVDITMFFCREDIVEAELEYLGDPSRLPSRCGSPCTASHRHRNTR